MTTTLPTDSQTRKEIPMCSGLLDYFPAALAAVAHVSYLGNQKHNPGEPLHHARGKSMDHADCIVRHLTERGTFDELTVNGTTHRVRHSAYVAWRALAMLQQELEDAGEAPVARAARLSAQTSVEDVSHLSAREREKLLAAEPVDCGCDRAAECGAHPD